MTVFDALALVAALVFLLALLGAAELIVKSLRRRRIAARRYFRERGLYAQALGIHVERASTSHLRSHWVEPDPRTLWR